MNTMAIERIEHEEAKKAADKSGRDWTALIDFRSDMSELYSQIDGQGLDEEQTHALFAEYFENLITDLDYEDSRVNNVYGRENTELNLSREAERIYSDSDPLSIVERMQSGKYVYDLHGIIEATGISAEDVEDMILSLAEEE